jgi:HK97 family phage major capsid protein/HK97 family phage prohead protease
MPELVRAYSLVHVKAVNDTQRTITGTATTPTPDRLGDIIEPLGVRFANPLPLLLYHDTTQPVGTVTFEKPTKNGIDFTAILPAIAEPGRLKDRVDEAWQSVKARLLRGVSIGFRSLNDAVDFMKDSGGFHYRETEVVELSLVTVPANVQATIHTIKAFDVLSPAPSGTARRVSLNRSGAADIAKSDRMKNPSDELTQKRAELKKKNDDLLAINQQRETGVLGDDDVLKAKSLRAEVNELTDVCEELQASERAVAQLAAPVVGVTPKAAGASREAQPAGAVEVKSLLPPGTEFTRYLICKMAAVIGRANGNDVSALDVAKVRYPDNPRIQLLLKAAVPGATTVDGGTGGPGWAGPLVYPNTLVSEFVEFLRPQTIIGKFGTGNIPSLRRIPFNVRIVGQTTGGAGYWVGQANPKGLTKFNFTAASLSFAKVANIAVFSDELARFSNPSAEALIRDGLAAALIERLDIDFIDPTKAADANVSPASITNGIAHLVTSGTDAAAVRADLGQLFAAFIAANVTPTTGVFIMSEMTALALSLMVNALGQPEFPTLTMKGGTLMGLPVITSQYAGFGSPASYLVILVNAGDIFLSDDGQVTVDVSREASLEMEDTPGGSPADTSGQGMISMFQTNQIALRAERYINWARRRDAAVAWLDHVAWGQGSP